MMNIMLPIPAVNIVAHSRNIIKISFSENAPMSFLRDSPETIHFACAALLFYPKDAFFVFKSTNRRLAIGKPGVA